MRPGFRKSAKFPTGIAATTGDGGGPRERRPRPAGRFCCAPGCTPFFISATRLVFGSALASAAKTAKGAWLIQETGGTDLAARCLCPGAVVGAAVLLTAVRAPFASAFASAAEPANGRLLSEETDRTGFAPRCFFPGVVLGAAVLRTAARPAFRCAPVGICVGKAQTSGSCADTGRKSLGCMCYRMCTWMEGELLHIFRTSFHPSSQ